MAENQDAPGGMMGAAARWMRLLLIVMSIASLGGCDGKPKAPPAPESPFIHGPPLKMLSREQLRALSLDCETHTVHGTQRGPYDAAYCQDAIDAWSDAPLESIGVIEPSKPPDQDTAPPAR